MISRLIMDDGFRIKKKKTQKTHWIRRVQNEMSL